MSIGIIGKNNAKINLQSVKTHVNYKCKLT